MTMTLVQIIENLAIINKQIEEVRMALTTLMPAPAPLPPVPVVAHARPVRKNSLAMWAHRAITVAGKHLTAIDIERAVLAAGYTHNSVDFMGTLLATLNRHVLGTRFSGARAPLFIRHANNTYEAI